MNNLTHITINVPVSVSSFADCSDKKRVEEIVKDSIAVWQLNLADIISELGLELIETSKINERRCEKIGDRLMFLATFNKALIESLELMDARYTHNFETVELNPKKVSAMREPVKVETEPEVNTLDLSAFSPEDLDSKLSEIGNGELLGVLHALVNNPNLPKKVSDCIEKEIKNFPM